MNDTPRLIKHVAVLVEDLEAAIETWSTMLGYTFGPIRRYRTNSWLDSSEENPHFHDARLAFSNEGPPRIELMEATGNGTHSLKERGFHHLGIGVENAHELRTQFEEAGIKTDGASLDENGRTILWFTDKDELDGIRLEFVGSEPHPIFTDDGHPVSAVEQGKPDVSKA